MHIKFKYIYIYEITFYCFQNDLLFFIKYLYNSFLCLYNDLVCFTYFHFEVFINICIFVCFKEISVECSYF